MFDTQLSPKQVYDGETLDEFHYDIYDPAAVATHRAALKAVLDAHPIGSWPHSAYLWSSDDVDVLIAALCWDGFAENDVNEACGIASRALGLRGREMVARYKDRLNRVEYDEHKRLDGYRRKRAEEETSFIERTALPCEDVEKATWDLVKDEIPPDDLPRPRPEAGADPDRRRVYGGFMHVGATQDDDWFEPKQRSENALGTARLHPDGVQCPENKESPGRRK
jgi:hypothetical protein